MAVFGGEKAKLTNAHVALDECSNSDDSTCSDVASSDEDVSGQRKAPAHKSRHGVRYRSCRHQVYLFLNPHVDEEGHADSGGMTAATVYQLAAAVVIIGLFVVDNTSAPDETTGFYWWIEWSLLIVWSMEHALRLWSCIEENHSDERFWTRCRVRWMFAIKPFMLVEAVSLASLAVDLTLQTNEYRGVAALRMLRLLTLYRIERDFNIFRPVVGVVVSKRKELFATLSIAGLVLAIASILMFYIEAPSNDQFNNVAISIWWGVTALTTVGYGDIVPETVPGRIVASLVAFMGTGMFGLFAAILADGFREAIQKDERYSKPQEETSDEAFGAAQQHALAQLLEERLQRHEEAAIARTAALQQELQALRLELRQALQGVQREGQQQSK